MNEGIKPPSGRGLHSVLDMAMIVTQRIGVMGRRRRMRAAGAARLGAGTQRLVHDLLDGPRATPALRAASQTTIDLPRRARRALAGNSIADVMVGKNVAGTNDHGRRHARRLDCHLDIHPAASMQKENSRFQAIPNY
jgi:hypothetical protein